MLYLSPEWLAAAAAAMAADRSLASALAGSTFTVEHVVEGAPGGTVRWHLVVEDGTVALVAGPAAHPDVRLTTTWATATAIARGALAAPRAFAEGRLRVGGDLRAVLDHQRALASVDDALAALRAVTTYDRTDEERTCPRCPRSKPTPSGSPASSPASPSPASDPSPSRR
ncbi:MAG TPA: SCP2 sterol-binding domain-containing protein [Acidimicrobiales bacterium]|nr:SCP2 sterol-binding domain-containing protein [Acidimicrobiales bacterium]